MRFVERLQKGSPIDGSFDDPLEQDRVLRMRVAADAEAELAEKIRQMEAEKNGTAVKKVEDQALETLEESMTVPVIENNLPDNDQK